MKHLIFLTALPLAAQIDMRMEVRLQSPSPTVLSSMRFVLQDNILRVEAGPSVIISNIAEGKVYIGSATGKTYVEVTQAEFDQLGKAATAGSLSRLNVTKLEVPAAPPFEWNGQKLQGKTCRYKIEIPGALTGGYEQSVTTYGAPFSGDLAKLQAARQKAGFDSPLPTGDSFASAMKECFSTSQFPVHTEVKMVIPQSKTETVMVIDVASLKQGPVDPALLRIPGNWARDTKTSVREALQRFSRPSGAERQAEPEDTKEKLLASIDELKRLIESENWDDASSRASDISREVFRKYEKAKPSLSKQLEDLEAKIAATRGPTDGWYRIHLMANAAELALKAGRLDKVRTYAQAVLDEPTPRPGMMGDALNRAHTLLGLLALKRGDKAAALGHLNGAGKAAGGTPNMVFRPRTELAEALVAAGETESVADYLDAVSADLRDEPKRRMFQTAAKNLRAGQPAYFIGETYDKYELPK